MDKDKARLLRKAVDDAIQKAFQQRDSIKEAVNWGDLHCLSVEWYETDDDLSGWRVYIEEASPDANDFRLFIGFELADAGFPNTDVHTEW